VHHVIDAAMCVNLHTCRSCVKYMGLRILVEYTCLREMCTTLWMLLQCVCKSSYMYVLCQIYGSLEDVDHVFDAAMCAYMQVYFDIVMVYLNIHRYRI